MTEPTEAIVDRIIDKIRRNRISSTEVADCLDKTGDVPDVFALNRGHFRVGRVFWVYAWNQSNWDVHEQIQRVRESDVVLVEPFECENRAIFGDLVSKYLFLYCQISALVVRGRLRDVPHLIRENWPIWYQAPSPIGCYNQPNSKPFDPAVIAAQRERFQDCIAVCDDSGVVLIPRARQTPEFLDKLDWIEEQEDIWFECIDRRKWNTFETVCLKRYLKDSV